MFRSTILVVLFSIVYFIYKQQQQNKKNRDQTERYLAYLPHSGFHNQRISLENGLLLANYLNRTLLVPPVYLSQPAMPWSHFDRLYERLIWQHKTGLEYCDRLGPGEPYPSECLNYNRWSMLTWDFFYNMSFINETMVRLQARPDMSLDWIKITLNTTDIYYYKDVTPFDFRIYDVPGSKTPLQRFLHRVDLKTLEKIENKVLHFGSVFGTHRVLAQLAEHQTLLKGIRDAMTISHNPILNAAAIKIVDRLGGPSSFIGVHIRAGDGMFRRRATITIDNIYHQLVDDFTDLTISELEQYYDANHESDRKEDINYEIKPLRESLLLTTNGNSNVSSSSATTSTGNAFDMPLTVQHPESDILNTRLGTTKQTRMGCQEGDGRNDKFKKTTIYIATDIREARKSELLSKIFKTFPCVFVLDDFKEELKEYLKKNKEFNEPVLSFMIPMVDALVSSYGERFYGTNASTFSTYIARQLHPRSMYMKKTEMESLRTKRSHDQLELGPTTAKKQRVHSTNDILTQTTICPSCSGKLHKPCTFPCGFTVCQGCSINKTCQHCNRLHTAPIQPNVTLQSIQVIVLAHPPDLQSALASVTECPICCTRFTLPTTTLCGHVFCNNCLLRSLDHQRFCPFCRDPLDFVPNPTLLLTHIVTNLFEHDDESADALMSNADDNRVPLLIGSLALPHVKCVIQIFEPRYRLMLRRIMESGGRKRLAMCLARRKRQNENEGPFYEYGTVLEINQIRTLEDGRSVVEAVGSHRFRVTNYELVDGYHMAEIERVDDVDREQENMLEQQQILRASANRVRQQQQQQQQQQQTIQSMQQSINHPPINISSSGSSSTGISQLRPTASSVSMRPTVRPPINRLSMSAASVRPMSSGRPMSSPMGMGQRRSWAQQAHPQTAQVNRTPWLQMHVRGLSAARPKKGPITAPPSSSSGSPFTPTTNTIQQQQAIPLKNREELSTEELLDEIVGHIEKLLIQQSNGSEWINTLGEPPALRQGRDRVILTWWIGNIIPLSEEERVTLLMMRTCRQRVQQILTWIDKFKDQWSLFLNNKPNFNCAIM